MVQKSGFKNHRLDGAKSPANNGDKLPTSTGDTRISEPSTVSVMVLALVLSFFVPSNSVYLKVKRCNEGNHPLQNDHQFKMYV